MSFVQKFPRWFRRLFVRDGCDQKRFVRTIRDRRETPFDVSHPTSVHASPGVLPQRRASRFRATLRQVISTNAKAGKVIWVLRQVNFARQDSIRKNAFDFSLINY